MNSGKRLERLEQLKTRREAEARASNPDYAPWIDRAQQVAERALHRLGRIADKAGWDDGLAEPLGILIEKKWDSVCYSLHLCGKPEPTDQIHWFEVFPDWIGLVPEELRLPVLVEIPKDKPANGTNWLDDWLVTISRKLTALPKSLTSETMGVVVRAILENATHLAAMTTYCKGCGLIYPTRNLELRPGEILPACPHCGTVGRRDTPGGPAVFGWQWVTYLTREAK